MNDFQTPLHQLSRVGANAAASLDAVAQPHFVNHIDAIDSPDARFLTPQPLFHEARQQPQQPKKKSKTTPSHSALSAIVAHPIDADSAPPADVDGGNAIFAALFGKSNENTPAPTSHAIVRTENDGVLGLAILDENSHRIHLQQFAGTTRHADALAALDAFESLTNIVLPSSAIGSALHDTLLAKHGNAVLAIVATRCMNTVRGRNLLLKFAIDGSDGDVAQLDLEQADVALGAAAALFDFVDNGGDVTIDQHSLRVELHTQQAHKMRIDAATAAALELVANVVDGSKRATLLGLFSTRTPAGERLLRRELLAPPCDAAETEMRVAAVAELLERDVCYADLDTLARKFIDFARTLRHFSHTPKQKTAKANEKHVRCRAAG